MSNEFTTSLYFAVGVFTPEQRAERDRRLLAKAGEGSATAAVGQSLDAVLVTIFGAAMDTLIANIQVLGRNRDAMHFEVERFAEGWPGGTDPEEAFQDWLASPAGQDKFGTATSVRPFAANLAFTQ